MTFQVIQGHWKYLLLVVCSNNVSILRHFSDTTTFTEYVTACNLEKSVFSKNIDIGAIW